MGYSLRSVSGFIWVGVSPSMMFVPGPDKGVQTGRYLMDGKPYVIAYNPFKMMNYYKATFQYDGTNYFGFQWQKDIPTIQNEINKALSSLVSGKITTMSASRTDTGVHALAQIVKITSEEVIDCASFLTLLNQALPLDIRCLQIETCEGSFNPTTFSSSKEYRYLFSNNLKLRGIEERFIANYPYELNIHDMQKAARLMVGVHDFRNFYSTGSNVKTTVREILSCELSEVDPRKVLLNSELFSISEDLRTCYQLSIEGRGFLKHMVRHLMSGLWAVGQGRISIDEFSLLLAGGPMEKRLWKVASPRGLYLHRYH